MEEWCPEGITFDRETKHDVTSLLIEEETQKFHL
jgi:hypothetical protein